MRHSAQQSDRFTLALKGAKCGIWDWNLTEDTLYFDPNYFLIAGYEPDDFPHIYDEWKKRVHPEDVALVEKSIQQYLRGEINAFSIEFKFKTKSGDWMWILGQAEIVDRDKDGNPVRLSGLHIDITERKHAEIELRKSEQKYRLLADHNFNWEYWANPQEGYHYISPSCERISGYRPDEFSANPQLMIDIVIPEHKNIVLQHSKDAHKKNTTPPAAPIEFQIITKNGEKLWLEHSCAAVFDEEGNYAGRRGSNRDISKRKQAEEEREQLLQAIDQSIEAIIIADDKGIIQYVNSAFEKITGYASEEAIGQNPRILKSGKHDEAFHQKMWDPLKSGKTWAGQLI
ncbi:MAG: PAS domain S-box protein, partial [Deltaproteobacteria bacterium]|nr:PAS domain S-box protein [Deltaproteobacteria bacterium]